MYVCKEVLSASTRKGTNKCESAQNGLKGNVNTRSSQAQPLYKIDKLVATGGPFKPELSILESCCASRYGKWQGCLLTKFWSLESRAQGGGKHINRVQFLELFEPF